MTSTMEKLLLGFVAAMFFMLVAACCSGAQPQALPDGISVMPSDPSKVLAIITSKEAGRWLVQGPLPGNFGFVVPKVTADGKEVRVEAEPGKYNVILIPKAESSELKAFSIELRGGSSPGPNPPPPGPVPSKKYQIAFILESKDLTKLKNSQQAFWGVNFVNEVAKKGHVLVGTLEVSQKKDLEKYRAFYTAAEGDPIPRVAVAPIEGGDVIDASLMETTADFWKWLEGGAK